MTRPRNNRRKLCKGAIPYKPAVQILSVTAIDITLVEVTFSRPVQIKEPPLTVTGRTIESFEQDNNTSVIINYDGAVAGLAYAWAWDAPLARGEDSYPIAGLSGTL